MADCGTYAGYVAHVSGHTPTCPPCRQAASDYARERRAKNPEAYAREKEQAKLRDRALRILGQRHRGELHAIVAELRGGGLRGHD